MSLESFNTAAWSVAHTLWCSQSVADEISGFVTTKIGLNLHRIDCFKKCFKECYLLISPTILNNEKIKPRGFWSLCRKFLR